MMKDKIKNRKNTGTVRDNFFSKELEGNPPLLVFAEMIFKKAKDASVRASREGKITAKLIESEAVVFSSDERILVFNALLLRVNVRRKRHSSVDDEKIDDNDFTQFSDKNLLFQLMQNYQEKVSSLDVNVFGESTQGKRVKSNKTKFTEMKRKFSGKLWLCGENDTIYCETCPHLNKDKSKLFAKNINDLAQLQRQLKCLDCPLIIKNNSQESVAAGLHVTSQIQAPKNVLIYFVVLVMMSDMDLIKIILEIKDNFKGALKKERLVDSRSDDFIKWVERYFNSSEQYFMKYPFDELAQNCTYLFYKEQRYDLLLNFGLTAMEWFLDYKKNHKVAWLEDTSYEKVKYKDDSISFDEYFQETLVKPLGSDAKKIRINEKRSNFLESLIPVDLIEIYLSGGKATPYFYWGVDALRNLIDKTAVGDKHSTEKSLQELLRTLGLNPDLQGVFRKKPEKFNHSRPDPLVFFGELIYLREFSKFIKNRSI